MHNSLKKMALAALVIKATHHEWNNSKEERFPLSDFQGLLFVFECVVVIITQKEIHTLQG